MKSRGLLVAALLFLGSLLLQFAWIAVLPPFAGIDEFDHAYRAAEVAHGEWKPVPVAAAHGRGDLVAVPRSFLEAATPLCVAQHELPYDNCHPVQQLGHGMVRVASAAATYNPGFYWLIGTPARAFHGTASLYAMRVMASLICSLLLALAGWIVTLWSTSRWPLVALIAAVTPVAVYSTVLGAPNGVEMVAGLGLWASAVGLYRTSDARVEGRLIHAAVPNAVVLVSVRSLGPLWLALIAIAAVGLMGSSRIRSLFRRHRSALIVATLAVLLATGAALWWTESAGTNSPLIAPSEHNSNPLGHTLTQLPLWIRQGVAAFPGRFEPAPAIVYACAFLTLAPLLVMGFLKGTPRLRVVLSAGVVVSLLIPIVLTLLTYSRVGPIWQGRYALPLVFGVPLLAGAALDAAQVRHRLLGPILVSGWGALLIGHLISVMFVLSFEQTWSPLAGTKAWLMPPLWVVAVLVISGLVLWALACCVAPTRQQPGSSLKA
jgi:Predicted membrane protein (DUF2142)